MDFLVSPSGECDTLVLLGDIFEFWIGKNDPLPEHRSLIERLEDLSQQGTRLVYVEGNHDFHLGPVFTKRLACQVLPDGGGIELDGTKIYLAHGDLANPADTAYYRLRKLLRSHLVGVLIRTLPDGLLLNIADRLRNISHRNAGGERVARPVMEILRPYAETRLAEGYQAVVTGHFHQPFHEKLGDGELIALGDWITQFSYAVYEDHTFTLKSYHPAATGSGSTSCPSFS